LRHSEQSNQFHEAFQSAVLSMEYRVSELENGYRQHGATLSQVARRQSKVTALQKASPVMRAQSYQPRLFGEFE
jgi:hypothetical protein